MIRVFSEGLFIMKLGQEMDNFIQKVTRSTLLRFPFKQRIHGHGMTVT